MMSGDGRPFSDQCAALPIHLGSNHERRRPLSAQMQQGTGRVFSDVTPVRALEEFFADAVAARATSLTARRCTPRSTRTGPAYGQRSETLAGQV